MVIGALEVRLRIIGARSLKEKRKILKSIKDRLLKMNVSVAEVGDNDKWQAATLGLALVSNDAVYTNSVFDKIILGVEMNGEVEILSSTIEIIHI